MADVRGRDPGQLFVVGALVIATLLVVLALFLNSGIYSENLAARNADPGVDGAVEYRSTAVETVGTSIYLEATRNPGNSTYASVTANHSADIEAFSNGSRLYSAYRSELRATEQVDQDNGTYVAQNTTGEFTNETGTVAWTLVDRTDRTRNFTLRVDDDLDDVDPGDVTTQDTFHVVFDPASGGAYEVYIHDNSSGAETVTVYDSGTLTGSCTTTSTDDPVEVDITGRSIEETDCSTTLDFVGTLSDPYEISFADGDEAEGRYGLVVDASYTDTTGADPAFNQTTTVPNYAAPGTGVPWRSRAVYSSNVSLTYRSNQVSYNETVQVAPGEPS